MLLMCPIDPFSQSEHIRDFKFKQDFSFVLDPDSAITEWDYLPAVGPRPFQGFVGLKNAGATCYMNSILQQLYMVDSIKEGILAAEGAATDPNEDFTGEEKLDLDFDCTDDRNCLDDNRKVSHFLLKYSEFILQSIEKSKIKVL